MATKKTAKKPAARKPAAPKAATPKEVQLFDVTFSCLAAAFDSEDARKTVEEVYDIGGGKSRVMFAVADPVYDLKGLTLEELRNEEPIVIGNKLITALRNLGMEIDAIYNISPTKFFQGGKEILERGFALKGATLQADAEVYKLGTKLIVVDGDETYEVETGKK